MQNYSKRLFVPNVDFCHSSYFDLLDNPYNKTIKLTQNQVLLATRFIVLIKN